MLLSIFDVIGSLAGGCWKVLGFVLELAGRVIGAGIEFVFWGLDKAWDLMTLPFTWGVGHLFDISGIFCWVFIRLLVLVALAGLAALALNLYRRYKKAL